MSSPSFRKPPLLLSRAPAHLHLVPLFFLSVSCASASAPSTETGASSQPRYPRRPAGCELAMYEAAVPGVQVWDDLGVAEVACHISDPVAECLRRLKAEACHLGGDIMYNVPRKPLRPRDQVLVYRAQVAHSRSGAAQKSDDPDMPPPASAEESAGPVVPLPSGDRPPEAPTKESAADPKTRLPPAIPRETP